MDTLELALDDLIADTSLRSLKILTKRPDPKALQSALADLRKRRLFEQAQRLLTVFAEAHPALALEAAIQVGTAAAKTLLSARGDLAIVASDWSDGARLHVLTKKGATAFQELPTKAMATASSIWIDRHIGRPPVLKIVGSAAKASIVDLNVRQNTIGPAGVKAIARVGSLTRLRLRPNSIGDHVSALAALEDLQWLELAEAIENFQFLGQLPKLRQLGLSHPSLGIGAAKAVADLPLSSLWMPMSGVGVKGAERIGAMPQLEVLSLGGTAIGVAGVRALAKCTSLRELSLFSSKLTSDAVELLRDLKKLTYLNLSDNPVGDRGAVALGGITSLVSLLVQGCGLSQVGFRALGNLPSLHTLRAGGDDVDDACAAALGRGCAPLRHLSLDHGRLKSAGATAISQKAGLVSLSVRGNRVGDAGALALSRLTALRHLSISSNGIEAPGAEALSRLVGLTALDVGGNLIGDSGVTALAGLTSLRELYVHLTDCTAAVVPALAKMTALRRLSVRGNRIGASGIRALKTALPNSWIET